MLLWTKFVPLTSPAPNSYVKALTPNVKVFGNGAFKEVINLK